MLTESCERGSDRDLIIIELSVWNRAQSPCHWCIIHSQPQNTGSGTAMMLKHRPPGAWKQLDNWSERVK